MAAAGIDAYVYIERGAWSFHDQPSIWLILAVATLLIALTVGVVTALGVSDARSDLTTLAAGGARARTRRLIAAWSALAVTGLGCGLGGLLGLVPAWGLMRLEREIGGLQQVWFAVPWRPLIGLGLVIPLVAFLLAALFTRSRMPMVRRLD